MGPEPLVAVAGERGVQERNGGWDFGEFILREAGDEAR